MTVIINCENIIQLMTKLFLLVKKKITINFRNLFDTAIGLRVLEMTFLGFQIGKFSGSMPPHPRRSSHLRRSQTFPVPGVFGSCIVYKSNINYSAPVIDVRIPHEKSWLRACILSTSRKTCTQSMRTKLVLLSLANKRRFLVVQLVHKIVNKSIHCPPLLKMLKHAPQNTLIIQELKQPWKKKKI